MRPLQVWLPFLNSTLSTAQIPAASLDSMYRVLPIASPNCDATGMAPSL